MATETQENNTLIERLFGAGGHFGFSKSRRHPSVKKYLFGNKQGTDIFDLEKTAALISIAQEILENAGKEGKTVLFVSTKEETKRLMKAAAESVEAPYVVNRWIGGMLTNFSEIKKRIARLHELTEEGQSGELERKYTKKERVMLNREAEKLSFNFSGVKNLERPPQLMVVIDPRHDMIAVREAGELNIPVIGIHSSDNDATKITYPVVVNDTLQSSVSLVLNELIGAFKKGKEAYVPAPIREGSRPRREARAR